jgi:UDP-N-acetylmuramoyl-L-alanyl-D-glutamate--2,6-diaminopimelate ligase
MLSISGKSTLDFPFSGGALMAKNLVLAIVMILESGLSPAKIMQAQSKAELSVPGRLERVSDHTPAVFVDYAHTPAGVQSAIAELKTRFHNLTVVLGASGNRDVGKRPEMAAAASIADLLVITDQHPRNEDPAAIRKTLFETAEKLISADRLYEIADPAEAIKFAIANTPSDSAVLWCGPGHLSYREIAGVKVPFDARAIAKAAVEA